MAEQGGYGGFWIRFLAYLVDSVILWIALLVLLFASAMIGPAGGFVALLLPFLLPLLYFAGMQASARQATFGKALLGLKVGRGEGERLSFLRSLGREAAKFVSALPLAIGFVIAGFTARKQALHDFIASTVVVREGRAHVVAALAVVVVGFFGPVILVMFLGVGILAGIAGAMGGTLLGDMMAVQMKDGAKKDMAKPAAKPPAPPAPAPQPAAPQAPAPKPAAAPEPAKPAAAPAPAAPPPVVAKPVPAPEPAKPVVAPAPAPAPAKVAAAPVVEEKPKPKPKPRPRPAAPKPSADAAATAPAPVPAAVPVPVAAPVARTIPTPRYNDLMSAVLARDSAGVQELIDFGRWVDKPDSKGVTPLVVAVNLGDAASAEALLKAGANPERALRIAQEKRDAPMTALLQRYGARR